MIAIASLIASSVALVLSIAAIRSRNRTIADINHRLQRMCPTCGAQIRSRSGTGTSPALTAHPCGHQYTVDPLTGWPYVYEGRSPATG